MIYLLAIFLPPLALLLNGQPFSAILNVFLILPCLFFGLLFHPLLLVPSAHAVLALMGPPFVGPDRRRMTASLMETAR